MEPGVHKAIKFEGQYVEPILTGEKTSTWRLWDDKNLVVGDELTFIKRPELIPFAKARIIEAVEKPLGEVTEEDMVGHETYKSKTEMYSNFSKTYGRPVTSETPVKIIRFELL